MSGNGKEIPYILQLITRSNKVIKGGDYLGVIFLLFCTVLKPCKYCNIFLTDLLSLCAEELCLLINIMFSYFLYGNSSSQGRRQERVRFQLLKTVNAGILFMEHVVRSLFWTLKIATDLWKTRIFLFSRIRNQS